MVLPLDVKGTKVMSKQGRELKAVKQKPEPAVLPPSPRSPRGRGVVE